MGLVVTNFAMLVAPSLWVGLAVDTIVVSKFIMPELFPDGGVYLVFIFRKPRDWLFRRIANSVIDFFSLKTSLFI